MSASDKMGLTLAQAKKKFGWSTNTVRIMANAGAEICTHPALPKHNWPPEGVSWQSWHKQYAKIRAEKITIREVFASLESANYLRKYRTELRHLEKAGFTRLDSPVMFQRTVTVEMLAKLSRRELLELSVVVLATMSGTSLYWLSCDDFDQKKAPREIRIRDLLAIKEPHNEKSHRRSYQKTRRMLRDLGFGKKDGPFLGGEDKSLEELKGSLITKDGLTAAEAEKFSRIALRRNWV